MRRALRKTARQLEHEINQALSARNRAHAVKAKRWNNKTIARDFGVPEDIVRRIYTAVQTAKKQGLYKGHTADLIERSVERKLRGAEYSVAAKAYESLSFDPPGGYGGPEPTGSAKAPSRRDYDTGKAERANQMVSRAEAIIHGVLQRNKDRWALDKEELERLQQAADELDVAADLYEEAGPIFGVRAGTLHERAKIMRAVPTNLRYNYNYSYGK